MDDFCANKKRKKNGQITHKKKQQPGALRRNTIVKLIPARTHTHIQQSFQPEFRAQAQDRFGSDLKPKWLRLKERRRSNQQDIGAFGMDLNSHLISYARRVGFGCGECGEVGGLIRSHILPISFERKKKRSEPNTPGDNHSSSPLDIKVHGAESRSSSSARYNLAKLYLFAPCFVHVVFPSSLRLHSPFLLYRASLMEVFNIVINISQPPASFGRHDRVQFVSLLLSGWRILRSVKAFATKSECRTFNL